MVMAVAVAVDTEVLTQMVCLEHQVVVALLLQERAEALFMEVRGLQVVHEQLVGILRVPAVAEQLL
jgi:hypothetical protein